MDFNQNKIEASVIISTYNAVAWLEKVIWGFNCQTVSNFEIVIADDGSGLETKAKIAELQKIVKFPIVHVWHEDDGFQKTKILNKAILASSADYLIFTDGDCVPRKDFIAAHFANRAVDTFLSGGYFKLPMSVSELITKSDIDNQNCFDLNWLNANGFTTNSKSIKLTKSAFLAALMNKITPTKATWNGHNASCYKKDILAVNGFNEEMKYGGEDRELGERLFNKGLTAKQIRYSAICIHLDHARGYVSDEIWKKNNDIRAFTKANKVIATPNGINSNSL
ncbi:glycosyl transferase family 2 [Flavobacterium faecale]|uniref:Glycosyl transferase family 2 n=1 Tax=Flavobacterium faecale TaxID=1355330 RepID=A0A2S1LIC1_9FLAO|nr:glycosyltransferase family 2 protein [Flavobacterium faecale]AWG23467.1 glycosyl transferase family 2 [Flavobacterium faecale]